MTAEVTTNAVPRINESLHEIVVAQPVQRRDVSKYFRLRVFRLPGFQSQQHLPREARETATRSKVCRLPLFPAGVLSELREEIP